MSLIGFDSADVSAFIEAQNELRANLGTEAQFGVVQDVVWPDGTAINPDTGLPYDATIVQSNEEFDWVTLTVLVVEKEASPLRPQADTNFNRSGMREGNDIILDVGVEDYEATVVGASEFRVNGGHFQIEESKKFTIANTAYRYLVYGAEK